MICSTDPLADMLSRIRNALLAGQSRVSLPHSRFKQEVANLLKNNGFLATVTVDGQLPNKILKIEISNPDQVPKITDLKRISKPGRRVYVGYQEIPRIKNGLGLAVLSTSRGLLTGRQARAAKIGGELICSIY